MAHRTDTFCPSIQELEFHPEGSFFTWICRIGIRVYSPADPEATRMELLSVSDEFGEPVPDDLQDAYFEDIAREAESLVDEWYAEFEAGKPQYSVLPTEFADYAEYLEHQYETGEHPAYSRPAKDSLPTVSAVPRSVRVDAEIPCTPGTIGYSYL